MVERTAGIYRDIARFELNRKSDLVFGWESLAEDEKIHISNVAASVMMTRDGYLEGGHFAKSIVSNNLDEAILRADTQISKAIRFMVWVKRNLFLEKILRPEKVTEQSLRQSL